VFRTGGTKLGVKRFENNDQDYPHYARLWRLMCEEEKDASYHPYNEGKIESIEEGGYCTIGGRKIEVNSVMILVGSVGNLSFLPEEHREIKEKVDKYTYQLSEGLFAVGQPTGDNFVKLNTHGCFAAAHSIRKGI